MRKIKTQAEIERKKKNKKVFTGGLMIVILVLSTAGYAFFRGNDEEERKQEYNGFEFAQGNGVWVLEIGGEFFYFQYLPQELENISVSGFYNLGDYAGKVLYLVNNNEASYDILINLENYFQRWQGACLGNCSEDLPVKNCSDNLIVFENPENELTEIWQNESCVFIEGDFSKGADGFLYKLLRVM